MTMRKKNDFNFHLGAIQIVVKDLDKAVDYYKDIFKNSFIIDYVTTPMLELAFLRFSKNQFIELVYIEEGMAEKYNLPKDSPSFPYTHGGNFCLNLEGSDSISEYYNYLKTRDGVKITNELGNLFKRIAADEELIIKQDIPSHSAMDELLEIKRCDFHLLETFSFLDENNIGWQIQGCSTQIEHSGDLKFLKKGC